MDPVKARQKKKRDQEAKNRMKNLSKEALAASIAKKKECNERAMRIVEQSIEPNVEEPWLLDNLKHINQSHFQDIVEERAITKICGYPLCVGALTNVPTKMYKISTRENKVYDITDRKHYCSNDCYKAGTFLKEQLYTSPLWLRDCEVPVDYEVLTPSNAAGKASGSGAEIDLGNTKPVSLHKLVAEGTSKLEYKINNESKLKHKNALSPDSKATACETVADSEKEISRTDSNENVSIPTIESECSKAMLSDNLCMKTLDSKLSEIVDYLEISRTISELDSKSTKSTELNTSGEVINENIKASEFANEPKKKLTISQKRKNDLSKQCPEVNVVREIEKRIESWFTLESMIYLLGQEKIKELLKMSGFVADIAPKKDDYSFYLKCQEIYRRLNVLELKDEEKHTPSKPLPDYAALKKEAGELELKVKSFFRGDAKVTFADDFDEEKVNEEDLKSESMPVLPLIDHCAVMLCRRRIVMDKLNKVIPDMLNALELSNFRLGCEIQELVSTFNLSATNICMRPPEWTLVAVILIKLLTLHNEILNFAYSRELTQKRLITFLLSYDLDGGYLDRFIAYLLDVERVASEIDIK